MINLELPWNGGSGTIAEDYLMPVDRRVGPVAATSDSQAAVAPTAIRSRPFAVRNFSAPALVQHDKFRRRTTRFMSFHDAILTVADARRSKARFAATAAFECVVIYCSRIGTE
jgi:hypothetical protein